MANEQEKSNLKDWKDVPTEYKWRAFDFSGDRWYYKVKPKALNGIFIYSSQAEEFFGGETMNYCFYWRETLEQRPSNV